MIEPFGSGKIIVVTPGTIVRVTSLLPDPEKHYPCHAVMFQVLPENTGRIYIGSVNMSRTARTRLFAMLGVPTVNFIPAYNASHTISPNGFKMNIFYVDADVGGDGVIIADIVT